VFGLRCPVEASHQASTSAETVIDRDGPTRPAATFTDELREPVLRLASWPVHRLVDVLAFAVSSGPDEDDAGA
jgi:hypothetical protein